MVLNGRQIMRLGVINRFYCKQGIIPKISIVGSGPGGFYAARHLLKYLRQCEIDIYEKLPVPFGLVRYGIAPDHPEDKLVENTFIEVAQSANVRFLGNVDVGKDITVDDLRKAYHIVILSYGADQNRTLDIPGENLKNILSAKKIVGWYNGVPWEKNLDIDLSGESVAILGQGNVAVDVARILLRPIDELKTTDITAHSLELLEKSKIKTVHLIGRRGPIQAAFSTKELRQILKMNSCQTKWNLQNFENLSIPDNLPVPRKRLYELMLKSLSNPEISNRDKFFCPLFNRTPLEFIGADVVSGVKLGVNELKGDDILNQSAVLTDIQEKINCQMSVISIGYKSLPLDSSINFDYERGVIKNRLGKIQEGLYTTGWLATGPIGRVSNTMLFAYDVAKTIQNDIQTNTSLVEQNRSGYKHIKMLLDKQNVQIVTWKDWLKIDEYEKHAGTKVGKPREKLVDIKEMLKIAS